MRESSNGVESHYIFHCDSSIVDRIVVVIVFVIVVIVVVFVDVDVYVDVAVVVFVFVDNKVSHILNQFRNYIGFHEVGSLLCI